jgi:hypothetical protein
MAGIDSWERQDKLQLSHVFKRTCDAAAVSQQAVPG